jgi:hypothetical protein
MSKEDLKIPTGYKGSTAEMQEADNWLAQHPEMANDARASSNELIISGQKKDAYLQNASVKGRKSVDLVSNLKVALKSGAKGLAKKGSGPFSSLINPPKLSPPSHQKQIIRDYAIDPERATYDSKTNRFYPKNKKDNNIDLQRINLDLWGRNKKGSQGLIQSEEGIPIEFGHGTPYTIGETLDPFYTSNRSEFQGVYASTKKSEYTKYMKGQDNKFTKDSHVKKLFVRLYNPLRLTSPDGEMGMHSFSMNDKDIEIVSNALTNLRIKAQKLDPTNNEHNALISELKYDAKYFSKPVEIESYLESIGSDLTITQFFQSLGYDGVLQQDIPHGEDEFVEAIIFNKGNVKSSTDNSGIFDETDNLHTKTKKRRKKDLEIVA